MLMSVKVRDHYTTREFQLVNEIPRENLWDEYLLEVNEEDLWLDKRNNYYFIEVFYTDGVEDYPTQVKYYAIDKRG